MIEGFSFRQDDSYYTQTLRPTTYPADIYTGRPYYDSTTPRRVQEPENIGYKPESITSIATKIQSHLDTNLNQVLDDVYRRHFSSSQQYQLTNPDAIFRRLESELKSNISKSMDLEIKKNYGTQIARDGHMYSIQSDGGLPSNYNYATADLETLKLQVERNLVKKLMDNFSSYKNR